MNLVLKLGIAGSLTNALDCKRQDVAQHKDLGQPFCSNDGKVLSVQHPDESAKDHVNGRRKQGWGEK